MFYELTASTWRTKYCKYELHVQYMTYNEIWAPNKGPSSKAGLKPDADVDTDRTDRTRYVPRDPIPDCPADGWFTLLVNEKNLGNIIDLINCINVINDLNIYGFY